MLGCRNAGWAPGTDTEQVPITVASGRTTAEPVCARWSAPAHELAAMDGIAVSAADTTGAAPATPLRLRPGSFDVVDTGDPLPADRDAVVMREHVRRRPRGEVELTASVAPGRHVRGVGEDVQAGELLLPSGHRLRPVDLAVVAGAGWSRVAVRTPPLVAVIPTGDEIRPIGTEIVRGEILDTNSLLLVELAREAGAWATALPVVPDDPAALAAAVARAGDRFDLVLVIAGSSAGRDDHTATVIAGLGRVFVHGAAIRPGHPVVLGVVGPTRAVPVVGVPGYPISAAHVFTTFVRPMIGELLGAPPPTAPVTVTARLAHRVCSPVGVDECVAVRLDRRADTGDLLAVPVGRGAGALSALMRADALLTIPIGTAVIEAEQRCQVALLPGGPVRDDVAPVAPPVTLVVVAGG